MLIVKNLSGGYPNHTVIKDMSISVASGDFYGIIGPNGSGKSTLLKMISGIIPFKRGSITIGGKPIQKYPKKELAKLIAVLPQLANLPFSYLVKDTVALGRYAYQQGIFPRKIKEDEWIIEEKMKQVNILPFADHSLDELSGGELQRVYLAQALAQEPQMLLLDEPTNHLDLAHQKEMLDLLKAETIKGKLTVVAVFHDLNLASLYCNKLLLLNDGQVKVDAPTNEVLTKSFIQDVYHTEVQIQPHSKVPKPQIHLLPNIEERVSEKLIDKSCTLVTDHYFLIKSPAPMKVLSTKGSGWYTHIINTSEETAIEKFAHEQKMITKTSQDRELITNHMVTCHSTDMLLTVIANMDGSLHLILCMNGNLTESTFVELLLAVTRAKSNALSSYSTFMEADQSETIIAATQIGKTLQRKVFLENMKSELEFDLCAKITSTLKQLFHK